VIDELMGHQRSRHGDLDGGSRIGARYRHTTDALALRVVEAIQERLAIALRVAEDTPANRLGAKQAARSSDPSRSADRNWHLVAPSATLRR
jgi:hypothetical protein